MKKTERQKRTKVDFPRAKSRGAAGLCLNPDFEVRGSHPFAKRPRKGWATRRAAGGKDLRIGGGVATIRQYLVAGQIDEMHLAVSPVLLGEGENLFAGINLHQFGFKIMRTVAGENATHVFLKKS